MDFNPDEYLAAQAGAPAAPAPSDQAPAGDFDPDAYLHEQQQAQYGTSEQQVKAGLEGVGRGLAGPIAPFVEKRLGVKPEAMLGREEANPVTSGVGEAAGLVGGAMTGTGEGALLDAVGTGAKEAAGLAAPVTRLAKVGSAAVQQAAEMAVLQSGNEASKMILQDPDTSAESAIANIGMAAALGGAGGAFITGAVSPLWKATVGDRLDGALTMVRNHMNGGIPNISADAEAAAKTLGVEVPQEIRGANATGMGKSAYSDLKRMENKHILSAEADLNKNITESVAGSLGIDPDSVTNYSENEAGHAVADAFKQEYKTKYEPFEAAFKARNEEANAIAVPDEARYDFYDRMISKGINEVGTDSPFYKHYVDYADRVLAKDTVGGLDKLATEINNSARTLGTDINQANALKDIRGMIRDFQEQQILGQGSKLEAEGVSGAGKMSQEALAERQALHAQYSDFAKMSGELTDHLGVGGFKGAGTTEKKLTEALSPEQLLKKFSLRNNADIIPFLKEHFPETLDAVIKNERMNLIKPAVLSAKGGAEINTTRLSKIVADGMAGRKDYIEALLPPEAIAKIQAAETLKGIIPTPRDSGTPAGLLKNLTAMPASAFAMVSGALGHNPIVGGVLGHITQILGREVPDAVKLGMLRFTGSDQPVKAQGFHAMVDFIHNTVKGESTLSKATKAVLKAGAEVVAERNMPVKADRDKLDKQVAKYQANPEQTMQLAQGHTGYYLPKHQTALTAATTKALQYLQQIKPKPYRSGPLDREIEPSPAETARYNRALDIANQPAVVLHHVKEGTLQMSDMIDLKSMYPSLYNKFSQQLSNEMINNHNSETPIPYKTRIGLSLFLGQPVDSSMAPASIMAAQPPPQQPPPPQPGAKGSKSKTSSLSKDVASYRTPGQAAEQDRSKRD